jgi:hypothetical protein
MSEDADISREQNVMQVITKWPGWRVEAWDWADGPAGSWVDWWFRSYLDAEQVYKALQQDPAYRCVNRVMAAA